MGLIQATIETLASVLGCRQDQAEDVVHSTASARAAMSRRGFFKAAGAVAAGVVMLDAVPAEAAYTHNIRAVQGPGFVALEAYDVYFKGTYAPELLTERQVQELMLMRQTKGVYAMSFPTHPASDWMQFSRVIAEGEAPTDTLWRFQDDTRELVCSSRRK